MAWRSWVRMMKHALLNDAEIDFLSTETPSLIPSVDDTPMYLGNGTKSFDVRIYGNTSSDYLSWDASANTFTLTGAVSFRKGFVNVTDAATYTVLAANSGRIHIMPNFTSSSTLTLPAAASNLEYTFISKAVADDAQNWIFDTGAAANFYLGGLSFADTDAGSAADEIHAGVYPNGTTNDIMTIVTPAAGTRIYMVCDGTNWIVCGNVFSPTVPTFSDT